MVDLLARLLDNPPEDNLLILVNVILFAVVAWACAGIWRLHRALAGARGATLTRLLGVIAASLLFSQALAVAAAVLIAYDRNATLDVRLVLIMCGEVAEVIAILYGFRTVRAIAGKAGVDPTEGPRMDTTNPPSQED